MTKQIDQVHHPIFARTFARLSAQAEKKGQAEHRGELLDGLSGRVVDVGAGNGLNFPYYPAVVEEVVAIEPERHLRQLAEKAPRRRPLCPSEWLTDSPMRCRSKMRRSMPEWLRSCCARCPTRRRHWRNCGRVIRPGGELRFYEHVISDRPGLARVQRLAERSGFWPFVGGGCHPARDTAAAITEAGFQIESCRSFNFRPALVEVVVEPKILGLAPAIAAVVFGCGN